MFSVMIVDDEPIIKNGLTNFINWNSLDCKIVFDASNGIEAKEKLESEHIDIIIADIKMPGINGIELAEYVYNNHPYTKVIILTGHADFSYAQSAIKFGIVDFIVKVNPVDKVQEAVKKAIAQIHSRKENENKLKQLEYKVNENKSELSKKFIHDVMIKVVSNPETILSKAKELDIALENYFVLVFQIDKIQEDTAIHNAEEENLFISSINNFLSLAFKDYKSYTVYMDSNLLCTGISFENADYAQCIQDINSICEEILNITDNFMNFSISIGISNMHYNILELSSAYSEACFALSDRFFSDCRISFHLPKESDVFTSDASGIKEHFDILIKYIQVSDLHNARLKILEILSTQKDSPHPVHQTRAVSTLLYSLLSNLLATYNHYQSNSLDFSIDTYRRLSQSKSIKEIHEIFTDMIKSVATSIESCQNKSNFLIEKVLSYIEGNYQKDITLQTIANYIHLNSSYLSRLFKKETGETITEAITRYRIQKAKVLLLSSDIKFYEVGCMVGISDSAYFSNVFKKYVGLSPKEYRATFKLSQTPMPE